MTVAFVVPWRPGDPDREHAWSYVRYAWRTDHPSWPVVTGYAPEGSWCKAAAVNHALEILDQAHDLLIVCDADVYVEPGALRAAVEAVDQGAAWAIPHGDVCRLTEKATQKLYETGECTGRVERPAYRGVEGGGIVVLRREAYIDCPLDVRFEGWGNEDVALGTALRCLHGEPWRGSAQLVHLWHRSEPRTSGGRSINRTSELLWRQYRGRKDDPVRMRALVNAGK